MDFHGLVYLHHGSRGSCRAFGGFEIGLSGVFCFLGPVRRVLSQGALKFMRTRG